MPGSCTSTMFTPCLNKHSSPCSKLITVARQKKNKKTECIFPLSLHVIYFRILHSLWICGEKMNASLLLFLDTYIHIIMMIEGIYDCFKLESSS